MRACGYLSPFLAMSSGENLKKGENMEEMEKYEPIVLHGDESPELREALMEFDSVMSAIDSGDWAQAHRMRGIMQRIVREQKRQREVRERNDSCAPAVGAFIDSLSDE